MYGVAVWVICAVIATIFASLIKQDLRRLNDDDVRNSEYIEEDAIKKLTVA